MEYADLFFYTDIQSFYPYFWRFSAWNRSNIAVVASFGDLMAFEIKFIKEMERS